MTIRSFRNTIVENLQPLYDSREAAAIAKVYLQTRLNMPAYELALHGDEVVPDAQLAVFEQDLTALLRGCPVQYLLGETEFYGLPFRVTPAVLIPRPETEELVQQVVNGFREYPNPRIWDVGTGSGCVAVALAKHLPNASLFASDISEEALAVAAGNAHANAVNVTFARHDMRDAEALPFAGTQFDAVVSNPPYIPESTCTEMHVAVRDYEPSLALFVPDDDPLVFYRALVEIGRRSLKPGGLIMMETYEEFHPQLLEMLRQGGYEDEESLEDINGRKRFCAAVLRRQ